MSGVGGDMVGARVRPAYLALLAIAVAALAGVYAWRYQSRVHAQRIAAADAATEALLARTTALQPPLAVDPTFTACDGIGDLCITSSVGRTAMVVAVRQQLAGLGIPFGDPECGFNAIGSDGCLLSGERDGARVVALIDVHRSPYWSTPDYAWVQVADEDHSRPIQSAQVGDPLKAAHALVPEGWRLSRCTDEAGCSVVDVRVAGRLHKVVAKFARSLVADGYGLGTGRCRSEAGEPPPGCRLLFTRNYFVKGAEYSSTVYLSLEQTGPKLVTGWIRP